MPSTIDEFQFSAPKLVKSGTSIKLNIKVTVAQPPKTLTLTPPAGYKCDPPFRHYTTAGTQDDPVFVVLEGPPGFCLVSGVLGASNAQDAAQVT